MNRPRRDHVAQRLELTDFHAQAEVRSCAWIVRAWMSGDGPYCPGRLRGQRRLGQNREDFQNYDGYGHGENDQPSDIRDAVDDPPSCTS
jgi:hypothetical protein